MPTLGWDRAYRSGDLVRFEPEGLVFQGPRRRSGQGRRPPHRAGRGRVRAAGPLRGVTPRPPPCSDQRPACPCSSAIVVPAGGLRPPARARRARRSAAGGDRPAARGRRRTSGAHVRQGRPGVRCRGRCPASRPPARRCPAPRRGSPSSGRPCSACRPGRSPTSSTSAAARWRPPSWSRGSARACPSSPSPTSTTFRACVRWPRRSSEASELTTCRPRSSVPRRRRAPRSGCRRCSASRCSSSPASAGCSTCSRPSCAAAPRSPASTSCPSAPLWLLLIGLARLRDALRADGDSAAVRATAPRRPAGPATTRAAERASAAVARRADRRPGRCRRPRRRAVGHATTRGRSAPRSGATSTCTRCRPSPACSRSATAPRSSRRSTSRGYWIDGDAVRIGGVRIGADATIGARSTLAPGTRIGQRAEIAPGSAVFGRVRADQPWAGSPAVRVGGDLESGWRPSARRRRSAGCGRTPRPRRCWPCCRSLAFAVGGLVLAQGIRGADRPSARVPGALLVARPRDARRRASSSRPPSCCSCGCCRSGSPRAPTPCAAASAGRRGPSSDCSTRRARSSSRCTRACSPRYGSACSVREVGRDVEASTVLLIPSLTRIDDGAFLADDTMVALLRAQGRLDADRPGARIGKRAFLGNSGMAAPGHRVPRDGLVAVLSSAPVKAKPGSSWLGSPGRAPAPRRRPRRRLSARTARRRSLRIARTLWELCRFVPVFVTCAIGLGVLFALAGSWTPWGLALDGARSPAS